MSYISNRPLPRCGFNQGPIHVLCITLICFRQVIRPEVNDARVHFALNCASMSCPPLRRTLFTGDNLDHELDEVWRRHAVDRVCALYLLLNYPIFRLRRHSCGLYSHSRLELALLKPYDEWSGGYSPLGALQVE